jgi:hypothetical protein
VRKFIGRQQAIQDGFSAGRQNAAIQLAFAIAAGLKVVNPKMQ